MYYVYLLRSLKNPSASYIGFTTDILQRLHSHSTIKKMSALMIIFFSTLFLICMAVFPLHAAHLPDSIFANAVTCSSGRDHTVEKTKEFKKKLNAEFMKKAKISDLVSYIYYPYYGDSGHAELEVEGACTTYKSMACERIVGHTCSFDSDMREKRVRRRDSWYLVHKIPFYRYVISVTPEQLKNLSEQVGQRRRCTPICSLDALTELARGAHYTVPLVARLSPFISALYLSMVKHLGSERIKKIEFYAGGEEDRNLIIKGILKECATIALVFCFIGWCSLWLYESIYDVQDAASIVMCPL